MVDKFTKFYPPQGRMISSPSLKVHLSIYLHHPQIDAGSAYLVFMTQWFSDGAIKLVRTRLIPVDSFSLLERPKLYRSRNIEILELREAIACLPK